MASVNVTSGDKAHRWHEFFEDNEGGLSMTRLLCFLSFWPSAYVVVISTPVERSTILGLFLGAYAITYVGGKLIDAGRMVKSDKPEGGDTNVTVAVNGTK